MGGRIAFQMRVVDGLPLRRGRNLTNDRYITGELAALDSRVFETGYVSDPLTFGVEVRKAF